MSSARCEASKVSQLRSTIISQEEEVKAIKSSLRLSEEQCAELSSDLKGSAQLVNTLSLKAGELHTYVVESSKVMGAAAESEEAMDALDIIKVSHPFTPYVNH